MKRAIFFIINRILAYFVYLSGILLFSFCFTFLVFTSPAEVIKTDKQYVYVRQYAFANVKSKVVKYPAPKTIIVGKVDKVEEVRHHGRWEHCLWIKSPDGKTMFFDTDTIECYGDVEKNTKVIIEREYYPRKKTIMKKYNNAKIEKRR